MLADFEYEGRGMKTVVKLGRGEGEKRQLGGQATKREIYHVTVRLSWVAGIWQFARPYVVL
jgi:hypothetical protein